MKTHITIIAALSCLLGACAEPATDPAAAGAALLQPFKAELKAALLAGMEQGPAEAIAVCKTRAPEIASRLSTGDVRMGRSSHRLRNPANAPPDWVAPLLQSYAQQETTPEPAVVLLGDGRIGYAEPIMMQPLCLTCHGATVGEDIRDRIAALYPEDQATGFDDGDFRGVFWTEFVAR